MIKSAKDTIVYYYSLSNHLIKSSKDNIINLIYNIYNSYDILKKLTYICCSHVSFIILMIHVYFPEDGISYDYDYEYNMYLIIQITIIGPIIEELKYRLPLTIINNQHMYNLELIDMNNFYDIIKMLYYKYFLHIFTMITYMLSYLKCSKYLLYVNNSHPFVLNNTLLMLKMSCYFGSIISSLSLTSNFMKDMKIISNNINTNKYYNLISMSTLVISLNIIFSLCHLGNFVEINDNAIKLVMTHHFSFSFIQSYIIIKYGLKYSIYYHSLFNGLIISTVLIIKYILPYVFL